MRFSDVFFAHKGHFSTKWEQYLAVYDRMLAAKVAQGQPITLLEIGVFRGGSLEIWQRYLPEGSRVIGVDIDPQCKHIEFKENIEVIIGNAADPTFVKQYLVDLRPDVVIDDGSHICRDVIASFNLLFDALRDDGIYIIEDVHTSYWSGYGGGSGQPGSHMEYFKKLADALNVDHIPELHVGGPGNSALRDIRASMEYLSRRIFAVSFYDSVIVVEKHPAVRDRPFPMVNTGDGADQTAVFDSPLSLWQR